ncbi:MAG: hypothetical protein H7840_09910 [Alphaproteobacteria bacterium]
MMTPEREAELFAKLDMLIDLVRQNATDMKDVGQRVSRVEGRVEEQSSMIQLVVAGRMGRKPAA